MTAWRTVGWSRLVPHGLQQHVSFALYRHLRAGLMGRQPAHARDAELSLALRRLWCQYVQVFTRQKNLFENYAKFGQAPSKIFSSALLSRKDLKKTIPKGHHISGPPRVQTNGQHGATTSLELGRQWLKCLLNSDENLYSISVQQFCATVMDRARVSCKQLQ